MRIYMYICANIEPNYARIPVKTQIHDPFLEPET